MSAADRSWADLPPELLGSIAKRLTVDDYIRFGAVCASWGTVASPRDGLCLPLAPQMPSVLHPGKDGESCTLVSLPDRRRRRLPPIPEMRGKWCVGSQDGWLALLDERAEVSLLNPLTRAQIHLPSITTLPNVTPVYDPDGSLLEYLYTPPNHEESDPCPPAFLRRTSFKKVVLSPRPTAGSYVAMAIFSIYNVPAFAKSGGGKWTLLDGPPITDIIYRHGKFLAVSYSGELWAFNVAGSSPEKMRLAEGWGDLCIGTDKYLVDSSGDLLQVWRDSDPHTDTERTGTIKVMRFDPEHAEWEPLGSLGDNSLFLGLCCSISLSAREISGLKPNCIYFTQVLWDWASESHEDELISRDVWVFNLEDGRFDRYDPPDPQLNWPPPLWIALSLL